ncbi:hypothetical protein TeGR_g9263 [Tetraparma gracilis]|uniref:Uncharacterized protein n=1 Tax=Tetraparma gracilis TaxID=2962635 RepID=A0ABQ6MHB5_9STRA|nr:hypothetical protein TeGR_g9263 [Tetraparma gracilis]
MVALEDKCRSPSGDGVFGAGNEMGREFSIFPKQFSSEMVIVEKLKTIFLVTRKTGCSTMINALHEAYGTDMHAWPASFGELPKTKDGASRMRTQELTDQAKDYYAARIEQRNPNPVEYTKTQVEDMLNRMESGACHVDEHLETQAVVLSSPMNDGHRIPIDFIIRMEHMLDDFMIMLDDIEEKTGIRPEPETEAALHSELSKHKNVGTHDMEVKTEAMDARVREVYHQDFVCFGGTQ